MAHEVSPGSKALRKGRFSEPGRAYIVTTVTHQRIPWFQAMPFARLMCARLMRPSNLMDASLLCWIVMPDHVHLLLQAGEADLSKVIKRIKGDSARVLNQEIGRSGRFWDPGFHDRAIRRTRELRPAARYIVANPLRAGLVDDIRAYPYWDAVWLSGEHSAITD